MFSDLTVKGSGTGVWYYANVSNSANICFAGDTIRGSAANLSKDAGGLNIQNSQYVVVRGTTFTQLTTGISNSMSHNINFMNDKFTDIQSDGIDNAGSSFLTITDNYFSNFNPVAGEHPDGIQFWTENTTTSAHDITVSGNTIIRGAGAPVQGIFVQDDSGHLPYLALQITNNVVTGEGYNGIAVQGSTGAVIAGNTVQPYADVESWIEVENSNAANLSSNAAGSYVLTGNSNLNDNGNSILGAVGNPFANATLGPSVDHTPMASHADAIGQRLVAAMAGFAGRGEAARLSPLGPASTSSHMLATPLA
jgi:hypothetical protein